MGFGLNHNCCCGCVVFEDKFSREDIGDNYDVASGTFDIVDDELVCTADGLIKIQPDIDDLWYWISFDAATSADGEKIIYEYSTSTAPFPDTSFRRCWLEIETGADAKLRIYSEYWYFFDGIWKMDLMRECDITFPSGEFHNVKVKIDKWGPKGIVLIDDSEVMATFWMANNPNSDTPTYIAIGAEDVSGSVTFDNLILEDWKNIAGDNTRPDCEVCRAMPVWPYVCDLPETIEIELEGLEIASGWPAGTFTPMNGIYTLTQYMDGGNTRYRVRGLHIYCYTGYGAVYFDGLDLENDTLSDWVTVTSLWTNDDPGDFPPGFYWKYIPVNYNGPAQTPPHTPDMICGPDIDIPPYGAPPSSVCNCRF